MYHYIHKYSLSTPCWIPISALKLKWLYGDLYSNWTQDITVMNTVLLGGRWQCKSGLYGEHERRNSQASGVQCILLVQEKVNENIYFHSISFHTVVGMHVGGTFMMDTCISFDSQYHICLQGLILNKFVHGVGTIKVDFIWCSKKVIQLSYLYIFTNQIRCFQTFDNEIFLANTTLRISYCHQSIFQDAKIHRGISINPLKSLVI